MRQRDSSTQLSDDDGEGGSGSDIGMHTSRELDQIKKDRKNNNNEKQLDSHDAIEKDGAEK